MQKICIELPTFLIRKHNDPSILRWLASDVDRACNQNKYKHNFNHDHQMDQYINNDMIHLDPFFYFNVHKFFSASYGHQICHFKYLESH